MPTTPYTGGVDYDMAPEPPLQHLGLLGRQSRVDGIDRSDHAAAGEHRARVSAAGRGSRRASTRRDTALSGHAGSLSFGKIGGEKTRFSAYYGYKSPGFDMNDLGFQRRADERYVSHWFQMRDNVPGRFTRSFIWNLNQWAGWNFAGDRTVQRRQRQHALDVEELLRRTGFGVNYNGAPLRDRITRGGPAVLGNRNVSVWYYIGTDSRKSLSFGYNGYHDGRRQGHDAAQHRSLRHLAADAARRRSTPASATTSTTTMRSGWRTRTTDGSRRTTCSAA